MRVFRISNGTSWVARIHDPAEEGMEPWAAWEAVVFEASPASVAQRLVYRPRGWLAEASLDDLAQALEEGVAVRVRWGE